MKMGLFWNFKLQTGVMMYSANVIINVKADSAIPYQNAPLKYLKKNLNVTSLKLIKMAAD
jgi:hypothetical protein